MNTFEAPQIQLITAFSSVDYSDEFPFDPINYAENYTDNSFGTISLN